MNTQKSLFEGAAGINPAFDMPKKKRKLRPEELADFPLVKKTKSRKRRLFEKTGCQECRKKDTILVQLLRDQNSESPKQRYFDETYVAVRFYISVKTLQAWRDKGNTELPFYKIGSLVRYRQRDILRYERAAKRKSTSDQGGSDAV